MGIIFNGIKYIHLHNDHKFKLLSLEDNVYFTLRDIFLNANNDDNNDNDVEANMYNGSLTNNIRFEERDETFKYSDDLQKKSVLKSLCKWLTQLVYEKCYDFNDNENGELDEDTKVISIEHPFLTLHTKNDRIDWLDYESNYIKYDVWYEHLQNLILLLDSRYIEL